MTKDELFRVMDALNPSLSQVKDYLDRMCGVTPLELVYLKDGKFSFSNSYDADSADDLFGFLIPNTKKIICKKTVNAEGIKQIRVSKIPFVSEMPFWSCKIQYWVYKEFSPIKARVAQKYDIDALYNNLKAFRTTLEILQYKGVSELPKLYQNGLVWVEDDSEFCKDYEGATKIPFYIESYGDLLIFTDCP